MRLYQRIIAIGLAVAGLAGLFGCKDKTAEGSPRIANIKYDQLIHTHPVSGRTGGVSVVTGDVNGDGIDELIVGDMRDIRLYRNNGDGTFTNPVVIAEPYVVSRHVSAIDLALSDVDNDGDLDLMMGDTRGIAIFYGDGKGNFSQ